MNEKNGSFKTIYKIKDSYKNNYLGEKLAAINMLFDFSKTLSRIYLWKEAYIEANNIKIEGLTYA